MKRRSRIVLAGIAVSGILFSESSFCLPNHSVRINDDAGAIRQFNPHAALNRFGHGVICWVDQRNGTDEIWAQVINEGGARVLANFQVCDDDPAHQVQSYPDAAMDDLGHFMVVWQEGTEAAADIRGRLFFANGQPVADPFTINDEAAVVTHDPVVAMSADGFFTVCWEDYRNESKPDIYAQRFDPAGNPMGGNARVNSETADMQDDPAIAMNSGGECLVVWEDRSGGGYSEIFGQRFDAAGAPVGINFRINPPIEENCWDPSAAMQEDGGFFVAWSIGGGPSEDIYGRSFDSLGAPSMEFILLSEGVEAWSCYHPQVSVAPDAKYFCVWTNVTHPGSNLWMRELNAAGRLEGNAFQVSDTPDSIQVMGGAAAVDGRGIGIAVWGDSRDDESDIRAAWFGPRMALDPVAGSGFDGIVPLSWSPVYGEAETRTVDIYRALFRPHMSYDKIATLDLTARSYPKRMLDWVDTAVVNDSTYCYMIRCIGDSRFSESVCAVPSAGGHAFGSAWSESPVFVDGVLNEEEWADAAQLSIGNAAASLPITLYIKNDEDSLFIGVDDPNDPRIDPANLFGFLFDEDNDGLWDPSGMVTEGMIALAPAGIGYSPYGGEYPASFHQGALSVPAGVEGAISVNSGRVQYEIAVSLKTSPLQEEAGETIGAAFWIVDPGSVYPGRYGNAGEWPTGALWDAAQTLGKLTLATRTNVSAGSAGSPVSFRLEQNYPNPFNPETTIGFTLKEKCQVKLAVFDQRGRELKTLTDALYPSGGHSVSFDASGLPSGIYLYKIEAGDFTAARKMAVMK